MSASIILFITSSVLIFANFFVRYFFGGIFNKGTIISRFLAFTDHYFIKVSFVVINFLSAINRRIQRVFRIFPRIFFDLFHQTYIKIRDNTIRFLYKILSFEKRKDSRDKLKMIIGSTPKDETHEDSR